MLHTVAAASGATSAVVATVSLALAVVAWRAKRATGRAGLELVAGAFLVFFVKNGFSAYNVLTHVVAHESLELVLSLFDLVTIALLFAPLVTPAPRRTNAG